MTTKTKRLPKNIIEAELAKRHFDRVLEYVCITEPSAAGASSRIKFEKWEHLLDVSAWLASERYIVLPKARQIGISWLIAAWALWKTSFSRNFKTLLFSQGEQEAYDLLSKVVYIWTHLPPLLKQTRIGDSRAEINFGPEWFIRAFPSTPKAGHGTTAGLVICDEADYHEYLEQAYGAVKPTIDDVGGQLVLISKCNPLRPQSLFKQLARGAPHNGFKCLFYPWNVRENRTEAWYEDVKATYVDPFEFQKSYPTTLEEALESPSEIRVVSGSLLEAYRNEIRPPIRVDMTDGVKRWQEWNPGRKYIAASDTGHGVGLDKSVTAVLDAQAGTVVAAVSTRTQSPLEFAVTSLGLLREYNNPTWVIEVNDWGIRVVDRAQALRYPRLFFRSVGQVGWRTTESTRPLLWSALIDGVNNRLLVCWDEEFVDELSTLVKNPEKGGRVEAVSGSNDDYCTAIGLTLANRDLASGQRYEPTDALMPVQPPKKGTYKWR